jgi:diadenosine tetraphosphatase ApaH/serine/threonine PP2A family protein phosphatase
MDIPTSGGNAGLLRFSVFMDEFDWIPSPRGFPWGFVHAHFLPLSEEIRK